MNAVERLAADGYAGTEPVLFYHPEDEWGIFSNFFPDGIWLPHPFQAGLTPGDHAITWYATGEHRYQAMKATNFTHHEYVKLSQNASVCKARGRQIPLCDGWGNDYGSLCWYVMVETVMAKAIQHPAMFDALVATGDRIIYEDSPVDDIWGWRYHESHNGKNLLGRALMQVRSTLA